MLTGRPIADRGTWGAFRPTPNGRTLLTLGLPAAPSAIVPRAFEALDYHRLEAYHFGWNPASGRVLEKAGFARVEGAETPGALRFERGRE